jgi:hypothetical protein
LTLASARALANAGILTVEDLRSAQTRELAMVPRIGPKSLAILCNLRDEGGPARSPAAQAVVWDTAATQQPGAVPPRLGTTLLVPVTGKSQSD